MVGIQYRQKTGEGVWHKHSKLQQFGGQGGARAQKQLGMQDKEEDLGSARVDIAVG